MSHLNRQERSGAGLAAGAVLLIGGSVAASSLLGGYPVLGGQAIRYLAAGLLLTAWARLRRTPLPRPAGREWAWLAGLAVVGLAGGSVLLIEATRVADPASVGVVIGAAPLVIVIAAAIAAGTRPTRRALLAAAVVAAGSAAAQLGGGTGPAWSGLGLLLSAGALAGAAGSSLLAAPVLPRLGALAVTIYSCGLAGVLLLAAAVADSAAGGPPILRTPTAAQLAALSYLAVAVTAVVFLAWYAAMGRLGVDRTGLFNGLIPITSLAAIALTGTGTITPVQFLAALTVLAGVILGLGRSGDQREAVQELLQVHDLPGDELGDREPDYVHDGVEVGDDAPRLRAGQAVRLGAQAEHDLVAVDRVDVEVDGGARAARGRDPVQQRPGRFAQLAGAERLDAPAGHVRKVVLIPGVHPGQGDPAGRHGRRQQRQHVGVTVARQRGDGHRVIPRVPAARGADVGMGVDPDDRQVLAVPAGQMGERGHADRALSAQGRDPGRVVPADDFQGRRELLQDDRLGLGAVPFRQAVVRHRDRHGHRRAIVRRQDRFQDGRTHGIPAPGHVKGELGGEFPNAGGAGALPLRPQQAQVHAVGMSHRGSFRRVSGGSSIPRPGRGVLAGCGRRT